MFFVGFLKKPSFCIIVNNINNIAIEDLRFILKTFSRIGIHPIVKDNSITVRAQDKGKITSEVSGHISTIASGPWPAFPTDLMSVTIVAATQNKGTIVFHEKMYEGRLFFTDKLMAMGANIVLCDPHRVVVTGTSPLKATQMSSPDVRAGMALVIAALAAEGTSTIHNIYQIDRGYYQIENKLKQLAANITRELA